MPAGRAFVVGQRQQKEIRADELIFPLLGQTVREVEHATEVGADLDVASGLADRGQLLDEALQPRSETIDTGAGLRQQLTGTATLLVEQREQHMRRIDLRVIPADSHGLRIGQCLLEVGRQFVGSHSVTSIGWGGDARHAGVGDSSVPCSASP